MTVFYNFNEAQLTEKLKILSVLFLLFIIISNITIVFCYYVLAFINIRWVLQNSERLLNGQTRNPMKCFVLQHKITLNLLLCVFLMRRQI